MRCIRTQLLGIHSSQLNPCEQLATQNDRLLGSDYTNMASITTILEGMKGQRVLVVGDVMLDEFVYGSANRRSPESDAPILMEDDRRCMPGGAANAAINVASLGGRCRLIGVCGTDSAASALIREISSWSNITPELIQSPVWETTVKTRFIDLESNRHLLRHDRERKDELPLELLIDLEQKVLNALSQVDVVVLSDYLKGALHPSLIRKAIFAAASLQIPVIVDPKGSDFSRYSGATVITPNLEELGVAVGRILPQLDHEVESAAWDLIKQCNVKALCVTRGHCGVQLIDASRTLTRHPPSTEEVVDVAGAGDTLVAALAMAMACGADLAVATYIANASAGIVIAKKAVATASHAELVASMMPGCDRVTIFPTLELLAARVLEWKDIGLTVGFTNGCFDLLHAGHVMSLTEARGRVDRLVLAINSDDSVKRLKGSLRPIQDEQSRMTVAAALKVVDAVIVFREDTPLKIISRLQPDIIFKGGDYMPGDVVGHDIVKAYGGKTVITAFRPGISTTEIISRTQQTSPDLRKPGTPQGKRQETPATTSIQDGYSTNFVVSERLSEAVNGAYSWLKNLAWPFWLENGLAKDEHGVAYGFHGHLHHDHPRCTADFSRLNRLLVIARQTYVFCEAMSAGLESAKDAIVLGLALLRAEARNPITGLYNSRFDIRRNALEQCDEVYDLYDHAFVLLAFASAMKVLPCEETRRDAIAVHEVISNDFVHPRGGFCESLPPVEGRRQNPHMHLFEAYLAAIEAFGPSVFLPRAHYLARFFLEHLWDSEENCVPEYLDESLNAQREAGCFVTEPGHLAEWARLLHWYQTIVVKLGQQPEADVLPAARSLTQFYERHGLDGTTRAVVDGVWSDGTPKISSQRLWPQTERVQAELFREDATEHAVLEAFRVLQSYIDAAPNGLWAERRSSDGSFSREPSPASSLYHLTSAITKAYLIVSSMTPDRITNDSCWESGEQSLSKHDLGLSASNSPANSNTDADALKSLSVEGTPTSSGSHTSGHGTPTASHKTEEKVRNPATRLTVVTGGAGFIGSNVVAALNEAGNDNVVVCDILGTDDKWLNLRKRTIQDIIAPKNLMSWLNSRDDVNTIIHMGAESSTQVSDGDHVVDCNLRASIDLLDWCTKRQVRFLYASSAATYGDGSQDFSDDMSLAHLKTLRPLNLYGWSKHLFDKVVATRREGGARLPPVCIGLKFFNVFGPNEYHKGDMASLVTKNFTRVKAGESVSLFRSYKPGYADGGQLRDFVYVHDVTNAILWLLECAPEGAALCNIGSGRARNFCDLVHASFDVLGLPRQVDFIDMPEEMRPKYQYFTQATGDRLRGLGYVEPFMGVEEAVSHYIRNYLGTDDRCR
jgi:ADP-L-glycero-D-manno-heptose-6-epimerase